MLRIKMNKVIAAFLIGGLLVGAGISANAYAKDPDSGTSTVTAQTVLGHGYFKGMKSQNMADNMKSRLDALVKAGTITQAQEDKIVEFIKQKDAERKAEMDKVKNMTDAERKAYFESKTKVKTNLWDELVSTGIINQTQADTIKKGMPGREPGKKGMNINGQKNITFNEAGLKAKLDPSVKAGTITQAQEDKIIAYFKQKFDDRKAEMDKIKNMTEAERKAYFESKAKTEKVDAMTELVKSGVITQQQADSLKNVICNQRSGHGIKGRFKVKGQNSSNTNSQQNI